MNKALPAVALSLLATACGPSIYLVKDFNQTARPQHKTVAVLPFEVSIEQRRLPKGVTPEMIQDQQRQTAYQMQSSVYSYFLKQESKDHYTISFQDIDKTNSALEKAGIKYGDLRSKSKEEIAQLLGVDAVVSGRAQMTKPMSDGAALAVGVASALLGGGGGYWGSTNEVNTSLTVHDGQAGRLLWKYDYQASGSVGSSAQNLTNALMRNASKKFPYRKS